MGIGSAIGGLFGGDEPDDVNVQVAEPSPAERAWASRQLELARGMREQPNTPT